MILDGDMFFLRQPYDMTKLWIIPVCLNCTVSGLVSRTFLRDDIIGTRDFHGAVYYGELADSDLSYEFIDVSV